MAKEEIKAPTIEGVNPELGMSDQEWTDTFTDLVQPQNTPPTQEPPTSEPTGPSAEGEPEPTPQKVEQKKEEVEPKVTPPASEPETTGGVNDELLWNAIPEKFHGKDKDVAKALERWAKSTSDAEVKISRQGQEISAATELIRQLRQPETVTPGTQDTSTVPVQEQSPTAASFEQEIRKALEEIQLDDGTYYDGPVKATKELVAQAALKIADKMAERTKSAIDVPQLTNKISSVISTQNAIKNIREAHPDDWDLVAPEFTQILEQKPFLANVAGVETAWDEAREKVKSNLERFRKQLGIMDESQVGQLIESKLESLSGQISQANETRKNAEGLPVTGLGGGQEEIKATPEPEKLTPEQKITQQILGSGDNDALFGDYFVEDVAK